MAHGSANLAVALMQMAVLATFARILPTDVMAGYVLSVATIALCDVLSDFGARFWAIRELSKQNNQASFVQALCMKGVFSCITLMLAVVYSQVSEQTALFILLAVLIGITQSASDPWLWRMRATQALQQEARLVVMNRLLISISSVAVGWWYESLIPILCSWLACNLLRIVVELTRSGLASDSYATGNNATEITSHRNAAKLVLWMGFSAFLYAVYYRVGILYLEQSADNLVIATFGLFFSLASASTIASNTLANVYYPRLSKAATSQDRHAPTRQLNHLLALFGVIFLFGGIVGVFIADWVVWLYAGPVYAGTGYLRHLIPWIYLAGLASCFRVALLGAGFDRHELGVNVLSVVLLFTLLLLIPDSMNLINRVILAYTFSEFASCLLRAAKLSRSGYGLLMPSLALSGSGLLALIAFT